MIASQGIPAVWVYTTGSYGASRASGYGSFLTPAQQSRLERIRQARLLFDGLHRQYFLEESRTQFEFSAVRVGDRTIQMYLTYNVLGLISLKSADLLFGESPLVTAEDEIQQKAIDALAERCNLHSLLYGAAVDCSYEAECFLEACVQNGEAYLRQLPADEIFPLGELLPNGQFASYVRYSVQNVGTDASPLWLLLITTYAAGKITRELRQIERDGRTVVANVDLAKWPLPQGEPPLEPVTMTGVAANTITWIPNLLLRGRPISDYDGAVDLQDALNAKNSQVGRVLMKHADPKLALPEEIFTDSGGVPAGMDAMAYREPDRIPKYITWNAELASAMADRSFALNQLLVRTETSPVLLGLKEGAAPDAYKKVRLESFNSLTKAARKAAYWKAGIKRAVSITQDLDQTLVGVRYDRSTVAVALRDGIPQDEKEQAERQSLLRAAGLMSRKRAIAEQLHDPAAEAKEITDLSEEAAGQMPHSLQFDALPPTDAAPSDPAVDPATAEKPADQADAVAGNDLRSTVGALNAIQALQEAYYGAVIPRAACIASASVMLGFSPAEAEALFPAIEPDAPGDPQPQPKPMSGYDGGGYGGGKAVPRGA